MNRGRWLLGMFLSLAVLPRLASAQLAPVGTHYAGKSSDTGFAGAVNATGGYSASIALDLPGVRGNLPVPVHVSYMDHGTGAAGLGWDVPLSYVLHLHDTTIARRRPLQASGAAPKGREQWLLVLDGQRIDLVPKGSVWVPRRENTQLEVRQGGDGVMVMYDGAGRTYSFSAEGPAAGSRLLAGDLFLLTDITGAGRAQVHLEYKKATALLADGTGLSVDLANVTYNPDLVGCYRNQVTLNYQPSKPSPLALSMIGGQPMIRSTLLKSIDTYATEDCSTMVKLRSHVLTYQADPDTQLPRLQTAQMFGQSGTAEANTPIPLGTFSYGTASHGGSLSYQKMQVIPMPPHASGGSYISRTITARPATASLEPSVDPQGFFTLETLLDFTGDGRPDWVYIAPDVGGPNLARNISNTDGTTSFSGNTELIGQATLDEQDSLDFRGADFNSENVYSQVIDVNGDGRLDIVSSAPSPDTNAWTINLNTPDPNDPSHIIWQPFSFPIQALRTGALGFNSVFLPVARRTTGHTSTTPECVVWDGSKWNRDTNGFHDGNCPLTGPDDHPEVPVLGPELTFTEWELKDVNGDGYVDLVFNSAAVVHSINDPISTLAPPPGVTRSMRQPIQEWFGLPSGTQVKVIFNVFGLHLDNPGAPKSEFATGGTLPFSSPVTLPTLPNLFALCGVEQWITSGSTQSMICGLEDVNGDGMLDRVEFNGSQNNVYLGTGNISITPVGTDNVVSSFFTTTTLITLPGSLAVQNNPRTTQCPIGTDGSKTFQSKMSTGLRDMNGDGIPDYLNNGTISFGTGTGFGAPIPAPSALLALSIGTEQCDGTNSATLGGLYDIDGDGRPEIVLADGSAMDVYQLVGGSRPGLPEAGRLIQIDNGYGASTKITYRSAKEDSSTQHQLPFPEIVVDSVTTVSGATVLAAPTVYAYGNSSLIFDPASDEFIFPGYGRTIALTTIDGVNGMLTVDDTYALASFDPSMPATGRLARYLLAGRQRDRTILSGALGSDAWSLLTTDVTSDARRIGAAHFDWTTRLTQESPIFDDCVDMVNPYDFIASKKSDATSPTDPTPVIDLCSAHGFAITSSVQSWRGEAGQSPDVSTINVITRTDVTDFDVYGQPKTIRYFNDARTSADDLCVDFTYANPTGSNERVLSAKATQTVRNCDSSTVYSSGQWQYDGLPLNSVGTGFSSSYTSMRYDDQGNLLGSIRQYDAQPDAFNNAHVITRQREDGVTRTVTISYDKFGIAVTNVAVQGTSLPALQTVLTPDPVTLDVTDSIDENGTRRSTTFDGFSRPVLSKITPPGGSEGILSSRSYLGFATNDPSGRSVRVSTFTDPVADASTATGRVSTTYLDELGRAKQTNIALGADYGNQTLIVGQRVYDGFGRVLFDAEPYLSTQDATTAYGTTYFYRTDGTPSCSVRASGRQSLPPGVSVDASINAPGWVTDEVNEVYPTCSERSFQSNIEVETTRDSSSLLPSSAQYQVTNSTYSNAVGQAIARSTWHNGTRLQHASFAYDRLGHLSGMSRFLDPTGGTHSVDTTWHYDSLGQLLELDEPETAPYLYTYSNWRELIRVSRVIPGDIESNRVAVGNRFVGGPPTGACSDSPIVTPVPAGTPNALDIVRQFDALGRIIHTEEQVNGATTPDTARNFLYDQAVNAAPQVTPTFLLGRLSQATSSTGSVAFSYDAMGQVNARMFTDSAGSLYVESHTYHADGTAKYLDLYLPDTGYADEHVNYSYDSAGRGRSIQYANGSSTQDLFEASAIDFLGRVQQASYAQATYAASYASTGRRLLSSVTVTSQQGGPQNSRQLSFAKLDPMGREQSRTETKAINGVTTSTGYVRSYDVLGRLLASGATKGSPDQQFAYDALGNLTALSDGLNGPNPSTTVLSYSTTDLDRVAQISYAQTNGVDSSVTYDTLGNIVTEPSAQRQRQFAYLADGHVRCISDSTGTNATFKYDASGNVQELHLANSSSPIADERNDRRYGDLLEWRDEDGPTSVLSRTIPGFDDMIASRQGADGHWLFAIGEHRGTRFVADETGNFVQDIEYSPYGVAHVVGAQPGGDMYTKEQWNSGDALVAFGISRLGERLYDPAIGRFLSRDSLLVPEVGSVANAYAFAGNDPVNGSDPTGMSCSPEAPACTWLIPVVPPLPDLPNPFGHLSGPSAQRPIDFSHNFAAPQVTWSAPTGPTNLAPDAPAQSSQISGWRSWVGDAVHCTCTVAGGLIGAVLGIEGGPTAILTGAAGAGTGSMIGNSFSSWINGQPDPTIGDQVSAFANGVTAHMGGLVLGRAVIAIQSARSATRVAEALAVRAAQIHEAQGPIAQNMRTTAVLRTSSGDIVAGGARDLSPAQRALLGPGEIAAKLPGAHAEITVLEYMKIERLTPEAMAVTRDICPECAQAIQESGGIIFGNRIVIWPKE